jgi:hypothetical protein
MRCKSPGANKIFIISLTSSSILGLDNTRFDEFIRLLDRSQGSLLRDFSDAVFPPVSALLEGRLEEEGPSLLERVSEDQILVLPKGSAELLQLIS